MVAPPKTLLTSFFHASNTFCKCSPDSVPIQGYSLEKKMLRSTYFFKFFSFSHLIVHFKPCIPFRKFKRADCGRCGEQEQLRKVTSHKDSHFIPSFCLSCYLSEIIMVSPLFSTYRSPWLPSVKPFLKCILRQQQFH